MYVFVRIGNAQPSLDGRQHGRVDALWLAGGEGSQLAEESDWIPRIRIQGPGIVATETPEHIARPPDLRAVCAAVGEIGESSRNVLAWQYVNSRPERRADLP